jgi:hypothetical protein
MPREAQLRMMGCCGGVQGLAVENAADAGQGRALAGTGTGAGVECDSGSDQPSTYAMPIAPGTDTTTITATPGARWRLTATYSTVVTVERYASARC